jgi:hypothetical protein
MNRETFGKSSLSLLAHLVARLQMIFYPKTVKTLFAALKSLPQMSNKLIETEYHFLEEELYNQVLQEASVEGVSIDYYLMEFTDTSGPTLVYDGEKWIED